MEDACIATCDGTLWYFVDWKYAMLHSVLYEPLWFLKLCVCLERASSNLLLVVIPLARGIKIKGDHLIF